MSVKKAAIHYITLVSISVAVITVSAWVAIPLPISITLQSLVIFLLAGLFPLKISLGAVLIYFLLGLLGAPVFAGFNGGISAFLGASGGFLIGFIPSTAIISIFRKHYTVNSRAPYILTMTASLIICYILGCAWYMLVFGMKSSVSLLSALSVCVFPFIVFDIVKILIALYVQKALIPYIQRLSI